MDTTIRQGRPPRMSRDKIVATATEIMAEEGYAGLSMRRLADRREPLDVLVIGGGIINARRRRSATRHNPVPCR